MFASFSLSGLFRKYFPKGLICLLGMVACKDFKNWESNYPHQVEIKFKREEEPFGYYVVKDLASEKLANIQFMTTPMLRDSNPFRLNSCEYSPLSIPLDPNNNKVSFEVFDVETIKANAMQVNFEPPYVVRKMYHQKVTIDYEKIVSMISHQAGGLQIQYLIKKISFDTEENKKPIFKKFTIEYTDTNKNHDSKKKEPKIHVTLYY